MKSRDTRIDAQLKNIKERKKRLEEMVDQISMEYACLEKMSEIFNDKALINEAVKEHMGLRLNRDNHETYVDFSYPFVCDAFEQGEFKGGIRDEKQENMLDYYFEKLIDGKIDNKVYLNWNCISRFSHNILKEINMDNDLFTSFERFILIAVQMKICFGLAESKFKKLRDC